MQAERIAMRQVRDVLRLNAAGVSGNVKAPEQKSLTEAAG